MYSMQVLHNPNRDVNLKCINLQVQIEHKSILLSRMQEYLLSDKYCNYLHITIYTVFCLSF